MCVVRSGALVALTVAVLASPSVAGAVTRTVDFGQPGAAEMPVVRGSWNPNGGTLRIPARHVSRSPQSPAAQTICAELTVYKFIPDYFVAPWAFDRSRRSCARVAPGHRALFRRWHVSALAYTSYNLNVTVTWRVTGGQPLSRAAYDYNLARDYRCQTRNCVRAVHAREGSIRFNS